MHARLPIAIAALAVLAAACGEGGGTAQPEPTVTVTVTETVTATPTDAPTTPAPTATTPTATPTGLDDVCVREGLDQLGFIFVTSPEPGASVGSSFTVEGCANVFEATVSWRLLDAIDEAVIDEGFATATCGTGCVGDFSFDVTHDVEERTVGLLQVFESSPEDGSERLLSSVPLILEP